jgi:TRAP-type uncharacterized transport system substrate-binding protein
MPELFRHTLVSLRDLAITAGPFVLLGVALLWLAYLVLDPTPPKKIVLATGPEQGAYAEFGKRYAAELKRFGISVELRTTQGAAENLRLLRDPSQRVDLAFVQGGAGDAIYVADEDTSGAALVTLGSLFYEPVWLFYREDAVPRPKGSAAKSATKNMTGNDRRLTHLAQLAGLRVNIGAPGSGASNLVNKLLHANQIEPEALKLSRLEPTPAVIALLAGELDALVFVSAPESPLVRMLLQTPGIRLLDFTQSQAYARRFSFLSAQTLPRGVVDLAANVPPEDAHLIAATASLLAREDTHPAVVQLFVQAAQRIHGDTGWFARAREFPSIQDTQFPVAKEAERFYRSGAPLLQRYLPFWFANLIDRMWVVLVSIVAVLIPLSRVVPPLYELRIRSRVFRWYARLREIEDAVGEADARPETLLKELDALDARVEHIAVPLSYADELYALRSHIDMVRGRLRSGSP